MNLAGQTQRLMQLQAHAVTAGLCQVPVRVHTVSRKSSAKQARSRPGKHAAIELEY